MTTGIESATLSPVLNDHIAEGTRLRKLLVFALLLSLVTAALGAKREHEFQAGKLIDVTADERLIEGTSYRRAIFTVQLGELLYSARGGRISHRSHDYAQGLIIGDPVQVSIDGDHLIFLKPDGKELNTTIIKRVRTQQ